MPLHPKTRLSKIPTIQWSVRIYGKSQSRVEVWQQWRAWPSLLLPVWPAVAVAAGAVSIPALDGGGYRGPAAERSGRRRGQARHGAEVAVARSAGAGARMRSLP